METIFVQWTDASATAIAAVFGCAQDPNVYPNQATIDSSDPRYLAFLNPAPTLAQQATKAMATGLAITSTATPALNSTYACDALSQADIIAIETSLNAGKGFPGGTTTFNYPDTSGAMHTFSAANFTDFAAAVRDFVYGCRAVIAGTSTTLPAASVTIA